MKLYKLATILLAITLLCGILPLAIIPTVKAGDTTLSTDPDPISKAYGDIGNTFPLDVNIADVTDLYGFEIKLTWENSLITFKTVDYTTTLNALWGANWQKVFNETGAGYYRLVVVAQTPAVPYTGSDTLFTVTFHIENKISNVITLSTPIAFNIAKLSDNNANPITVTLDDGLYQISPHRPSLQLGLIDPNPAKPFEWGKTFNVTVHVTCEYSLLIGYNITVKYDPELFKYSAMYSVGNVLGPTTVPKFNNTAGTIRLTKTNNTGYIGADGKLFTVIFKINFDDRIEHIWRTGATHDLTGSDFSFFDAKLTFTEGPLSLGEIDHGTVAAPTVHLIKGDVTCDGTVDISDLVAVSTRYDQFGTGIAKYDLAGQNLYIDVYDLIIISSNWWYGVPP